MLSFFFYDLICFLDFIEHPVKKKKSMFSRHTANQDTNVDIIQ